jgi:hypothetical protein
MRPRAAVGQASPSFEAVPADPLVARCPTDALGPGRTGHRPSIADHAIDQELAAKPIESRRTMRHESLLAVRSFNTPYRARRLSLVNNAPKDDS